jgi:hypothetical protein
MSKRTTSTEYLFLVVAIRRETRDESPPSSAFRAAPVAADGPGLAKVEPQAFPFKKAVAR